MPASSELVTDDSSQALARPESIRERRFVDRLFDVDARRLSYIALAAMTVAVLVTFRHYGISWDEDVQDQYGRDLLSYYLSGLRDQSAFHFGNLFYYGGSFDLAAAILNTVSPLGQYETRHLLGGLVGVIGALGAGRLATLLAGERAGFFAIALTALTPLLYGHNFFNPKDAPFAYALVWSLYYLCRAIVEAPRPKWSTVIGLGVAFGITLATRVVAVIALVYCVPALVAYVVGRYIATGDMRSVASRLAVFARRLLPAVPIALLLTALLWPWVAQAPGNLVTALQLFSSFPWDGPVLFDGETYWSTALPASYLPKLIAVQMPEMVLLGLALAVLFGARAARSLRWPRLLTDPRVLCYSVVLTAIFVPLVHFIVFRPLAHNGIRHYLFMVAPLIVIAAIGVDGAYAWLRSRQRGVARAFAAMFAVWAGVQIATMVALHPDEYTYYNRFAGGVAGAEGRYELDYWGVSLAEATRDLERIVARDRSGTGPLRLYVCGDSTSATYFLRPDSRLVYTESLEDADFALALAECLPDIVGHVVVQVRRDGALLSYATDLRGKKG